RGLVAPTSNPAVEEMLSILGPGCPQVPTSGEDLELGHHVDQQVSLTRQDMPGVHQGEVALDYPSHGLGPGFFGPIRLGPRIRPLIREFAGRSKLHSVV